MKTAILGAAAFAFGLALAAATRAAPERPAVVTADKLPGSGEAPAGSLCTGGAESPMEVTITPERTTSSRGGEILEYSVRLRNTTSEPIRGRVATELVTDTGHEVTSPELGDIVDITPGAEHARVHATPAGLADGFYILRVTSAVVSPWDASTGVAHLYLEVQVGHIVPLDMEEFHARSRANEGVVR